MRREHQKRHWHRKETEIPRELGVRGAGEDEEQRRPLQIAAWQPALNPLTPGAPRLNELIRHIL